MGRNMRKRATGGGRENPELEDIGAKIASKRKKKRKGGAFVLTFGKFKGRQLSNVPGWYLDWIEKNLGDDFRETVNAVKRFRKGRKPAKQKTLFVSQEDRKLDAPYAAVHPIPEDVVLNPLEECPF